MALIKAADIYSAPFYSHQALGWVRKSRLHGGQATDFNKSLIYGINYIIYIECEIYNINVFKAKLFFDNFIQRSTFYACLDE